MTIRDTGCSLRRAAGRPPECDGCAAALFARPAGEPLGEGAADVQGAAPVLVVGPPHGMHGPWRFFRIRAVDAGQSLGAVHGGEVVEGGADAVGELLPGQVLIGEGRVAAERGCFQGIEHGELGRTLVVGHVRVPVLIDVAALPGILQLDDLGVAVEAGIGMPHQLTPAASEGHLLFRGERLTGNDQHVMRAEERVELTPDGVVDGAHVQTFDDGPERRGQATDFHLRVPGRWRPRRPARHPGGPRGARDVPAGARGAAV